MMNGALLEQMSFWAILVGSGICVCFFILIPLTRRFCKNLADFITVQSREEYLREPVNMGEAETQVHRIRLVQVLAWLTLRGKERIEEFGKLAKLRRETGEFIVVVLSKEFHSNMLYLAAVAEGAMPPKAHPHYAPLSLVQVDLREQSKLLDRIRAEACDSGLMEEKSARSLETLARV